MLRFRRLTPDEQEERMRPFRELGDAVRDVRTAAMDALLASWLGRRVIVPTLDWLSDQLA